MPPIKNLLNKWCHKGMAKSECNWSKFIGNSWIHIFFISVIKLRTWHWCKIINIHTFSTNHSLKKFVINNMGVNCDTYSSGFLKDVKKFQIFFIYRPWLWLKVNYRGWIFPLFSALDFLVQKIKGREIQKFLCYSF